MTKEFDVPIIFAATHCVQNPGGKGNSSDGNREYVPGLIRAAVAQGGIDGVFMECHQDPDNAPSDGPNMLRLDDVEKVFKDIKRYSYDN